jgi:hypothetical protein
LSVLDNRPTVHAVTELLQHSPAPDLDAAAPYDRAREVEAILDADTTNLGLTWRTVFVDGMSASRLGKKLGRSHSFVSRERALVFALRDGEIPTGTATCRAAAGRIGVWLRSAALELSPQLRDDLAETKKRLLDRAEELNPSLNEDDDESAAPAAVVGIRCVYVLTLPRYMPDDEAEDNPLVLVKVGQTKNLRQRLKSASAQAFVPEEPEVLRVYPCADPASAESLFHSFLHAAAQAQPPRVRGAQKEWFYTRLAFLDRIAEQVGLPIMGLDGDQLFDATEGT